MRYKQINDIAGWGMFLLSLIVFTLTVEPTASFWDCGEFIAVSYKLMVPHPPGAPLFLLIGRIFSFLAFDDVERVAFWVNMVSVVSSAATILFLYWTITMLAKRLLVKNKSEEPQGANLIGIVGSGIIGAAAFTFSDSFWFSAVEAEVYSMSSAFTAIVFWAALKWEARADDPNSDRWLLFIAYTVGLSIGVHLLNLVAIPAIAAVYYYKKFKPSTAGFLITIAIGVAITGFITWFIIPGLPSIAGSFEIFFVNSMGMPFNSGAIIFSLLLIGGLIYGLIYSIKIRHRILNLSLLATVLILIGYSSYGIIYVRSNANPTIDENDPENMLSLTSYLKREQYGERPLLYGPQFTANVIAQENGDPIYVLEDNEYKIVGYKTENEFDPEHSSLFPRMHSQQSRHINAYKSWVKMPEVERGEKPSFGHNLEYFFKYQVNWMFFRYFFWNFSGRQADWQDARWLPTNAGSNLPHSMRTNKAYNTFFMLPFILGLLGLFYQWRYKREDAIIVLLLFFFTGLAIIIYLNQPPIEPRERDYTFVGAFYSYAIWIGLGVLMVGELFSRFIKSRPMQFGLATGICLVVPIIMAAEGWDDHDRSIRWHSVDSAKNLLNSCAPNAILFTGGDNDTFPLWYVQEVEGFRTDVRVCNLSLLGTDWYIKQMKQQAYESEPLPITMKYAENFIQGTNDYVPFVENKRVAAKVGNAIDLKLLMKLIREKDPAVMRMSQGNKPLATYPMKKFKLPVPKDKDFSYIPEDKKRFIVDEIIWDYKDNAMYKNKLIMMDILAHNEWERPIYFSTTLGGSDYLGLKEYMQLEGLAYRLTPAKVPGATDGWVNAEIMYDRMMGDNMFWRELDNPNVHYDENYKRFPLNSRNSFYKLAVQYLNEGKKEKAVEVLDYSNTIMPDKSIPFDVYTIQFADVYFKADQEEKALDMINLMTARAEEEIEYWKDESGSRAIGDHLRQNMYILYNGAEILRRNGKQEEAQRLNNLVENYSLQLQGRF